jgi:hypothetical protein
MSDLTPALFLKEQLMPIAMNAAYKTRICRVEREYEFPMP